MAKLKDFSKVLERELKAAADDVKKPTNMKLLARSLRLDIIKRIKLGFGVKENGNNKEKFKPLSDSYKKQRKKKLGFWTRSDGVVVPIETEGLSRKQIAKNKKYLKQNLPDLDGTTSAAKSNLTRTGQMLESLKERIGNGKFSLFFDNSKAKKKADFVQNERPFMAVSKQELKRLEKLIQSLIREAIVKIKF